MSHLTNYTHISAMVFNTPLLATANLAKTVSEFLQNRLLHGTEQIIKPSADIGAKKAQELLVGAPEQGEKISVISVHGALVPRMGFIDNACEEVMSYERLQNQINSALKDDGVQEIVLDINSGGGSAQGAFECADFIKKATEKKPVRAIINMNAYSGAYLIASACSEIIISKTAGVGSVGVYLKRLDLTKRYEQEGIEVHTFFRGATKVDFHPDIKLTEEEKHRIETSTEETYQMFVEYVSKNRNLTIDETIATQADTYLGQKAIDLGLADRLATPQDAINSIVRNVAIQSDNKKMLSQAAELRTI